MNQIQKFLTRLVPKERQTVEEVIRRVLSLELAGLDVKKLKSLENMFRVRKGGVRIIFSVEDKIVTIRRINRRNDNTYN